MPTPTTENWPARHRPAGRLWFFRVVLGVLGLLFVMQLACGVLGWGAWWLWGGPDRDRPDHSMEPPSVARLAWIPVLGGLMLVGGALAVMVLRRTTAPVLAVMTAAERVAEGDYTVRVPETPPTETRNLARAFNTMTSRLQSNEANRRRLLADITHELRTPASVIQSHLEAMLDGVYPRDDDHLTSILDETRVLARLIEDLRTLSLAESGALHLQREPTDLAVLVEDTISAFVPQANRAQLTLHVITPPDLPWLDLDPVRIREILANLLSNALRHTSAGGTITVQVQCTPTTCTVTVQDTGAGMAPDMLLHVFDRFYKSDESRGSGLGLAIARSLAVAHGGDLTVTSTPGVGSAFTLHLPSAV